MLKQVKGGREGGEREADQKFQLKRVIGDGCVSLKNEERQTDIFQLISVRSEIRS